MRGVGLTVNDADSAVTELDELETFPACTPWEVQALTIRHQSPEGPDWNLVISFWLEHIGSGQR